MEGTAEIRTGRLILRRYRTEDANELYEKLGKGSQMYKYSGWNPYADPNMASETVRRFIDSYGDTTFYGWAIEYSGRLIGTIGAYDYDSDKNQIETGFSIERGSWGQGFATEALTAVLAYLTEHEGIGTVTAWCAAENIGSMKAMLKADMKQTHTEKNGLKVDRKLYDKLLFGYYAG
jgi:ribosomal-protein-alanine N-acetyltransferase